MKNFSLIITAGGTSSRYGNTNKLLEKINDKTVIEETVSKFIDFDEIDETRYQSYVEFVKEAQEYKERVKYQGVKTESTHKQQHNKTAVKISSRKRESARNTLKQNIYKDIEDEGIN